MNDTAPLAEPRRVLLSVEQSQFVDASKPFVGFVGGIGSGKTRVLCYNRLMRAQPRGVYMMVAPTYPMLRDATLRSFSEVAYDLGKSFSFHKAEMIATMPNGAEILFRSGDAPDRLRGPNLDEVDLDEASQMKRDVYDVCIGRLRRGGKLGRLRAAFTPQGKDHWTYEVFGRENRDTALVHAKTRDNPFIAEDFVDALELQYSPMRARQELEGQFVEMEGAEWPAEWFPESHWIDEADGKPFWPPPQDITLRVMGVDSSKGRDGKTGDYSAIVSMVRSRQGLLYVEADLERRPMTNIIADAISIGQRFQRETGGEPLDGVAWEADSFQELLADECMKQTKAAGFQMPIFKVFTGSVAKDVRIRRLTPYLSGGNFRWRNTPGTQRAVQQMRQFPMAEHDDGPDALEMAVRMGVKLWLGGKT